MTQFREEAIKEGKVQKNYPIHEIALSCDQAMARGGTVYQKWTCLNPLCGARQTMDKANTLFTSGKCEECNQVSPIKECNFTAVFAAGSDISDIMAFIGSPDRGNPE